MIFLSSVITKGLVGLNSSEASRLFNAYLVLPKNSALRDYLPKRLHTKMSSNTNLYGIRKPKKAPKEISSSNVLAFTSILSPLISSAQRTSTGRPRTSHKRSDDIFKTHRKSSKKRGIEEVTQDQKVKESEIEQVDEATLYRSKRKMEAKAKIYAQMKRGEISENAETLVNFDSKWAEQQVIDSESDLESDNGQGDMIEYDDEFGRSRRGTRAEVERMERKKRITLLSAEELAKMRARPEMPSKINYGDTIQTMAFNPDDPVVEKMKRLAAKRDRSLTPPEMKHYEADKEVRTKGVGFYCFSKDETIREQEMRALEQERLETEKKRKEREEKKKNRLLEIEERRKVIQKKRAMKQADGFLNSLDVELNSTAISK